jgi:dephospho-CoA kinase
MKILILGHARHGKDTVAEMIKEIYGLTFTSSSQAAAEIFLYPRLRHRYGYNNPQECYNDRVNRRKEWYDEICAYNKEDKARLAKAILERGDMYVGMRDNAEIEECIKQGLFDKIIGVFNPMMPLESRESFNIDMWKYSDVIIPNAGTLHDLKMKVFKLF